VLELFKVRYYATTSLIQFLCVQASSRSDNGNVNCAKDIEVIFKMYLVQFINPAKSLVAIHAVMSQKFGFACNDDDASGVRPGGRGRE